VQCNAVLALAGTWLVRCVNSPPEGRQEAGCSSSGGDDVGVDYCRELNIIERPDAAARTRGAIMHIHLQPQPQPQPQQLVMHLSASAAGNIDSETHAALNLA